MLILLVTWICVIGRVVPQSAPTFCSHIEGTQFTCDYSSMISSSNRPISYDDFSPEPQRLEVIARDVFIPFIGDSQMFSSAFGGINIANFDYNYPASVTIDCEGHNTMFFTGAFSNMSHVQKFEISNCGVYDIPARAFAGFGNLDSLRVQRGFIDTTNQNAWIGLNIEKLTSDSHSFPRNLGSVEILYTKFLSTTVPIGLLFNMKNLTSATLRGAGISSLTTDIFTFNTKLKLIDISDNEFTSIPNGLFDNLNSLSQVSTENIPWKCTCENLWFVTYITENNITLIGDNMCDNANGKSILKYYYENCANRDPCKGISGFALGNRCVTVMTMVVALLAFAALITTVVALVMLEIAKRTHKQKDKKRRQAIGRWNQVIDRTIAGMKAPK